MRTSDQGRSSTTVSDELKDLAEIDKSYKITNAKMFIRNDGEVFDRNHNVVENIENSKYRPTRVGGDSAMT